MMPPISSSWVVLCNGAVVPARPRGGLRYTPVPKVDALCVVCGAAFRGRAGRRFCFGPCARARREALA